MINLPSIRALVVGDPDLARYLPSQSPSNMSQIFADFVEEMPPCTEYLILACSPSSLPIKQRWRTNGLSADFLADYVMTFFPGGDERDMRIEKPEEIRASINYIVNELLENAMKFSDESSPYPITVQIYLYPETIAIITHHGITRQQQAKLEEFIDNLQKSDPAELYFQQLEKNALEDSSDSGLGYLTILNDYDAKLGWKLETITEPTAAIALTTMVQLSLLRDQHNVR